MSDLLSPENPELKLELYRIFRDFFARAERKRRWVIERDIPWGQVNRHMDPTVATVVESFCAVELFLPDYVSKAIPLIRQNRGWAWMHINWGYEETKHSMALGDWLLKSGARTEEQLHDLENRVFAHEWNLPEDSGAGMLVYAMTQELATWVHYRRLQDHVKRVGDPALETTLSFIAVDERSHHSIYKEITKLFLKIDRAQTVELLRRVLRNFAMPAVYMLADSEQRAAQVRSLNIFSEEIFFTEVYDKILTELGVTRAEIRGPRPKKSA